MVVEVDPVRKARFDPSQRFPIFVADALLHVFVQVALCFARESLLPPRAGPADCSNLPRRASAQVCDPLLQRAAAVRSLGAVRAVQEQSLMRINSDGSKQLDHKGAELLLKIVALQVCMRLASNSTPSKRSHRIGSQHSQDKQLLALDAARMPPPPSRAPGGSR